jgi:hypothetical protein
LIFKKINTKDAFFVSNACRCLGLFYVGMATSEKTKSYAQNARRGAIEDKVTWL